MNAVYDVSITSAVAKSNQTGHCDELKHCRILGIPQVIEFSN
jgi:hypothetical protein